jgi:L-alanine-DL-glutamate epimerase-like enolase superfamily enzyme
MTSPAPLAAWPVTALTAASYTIPTDAPEADGTLSWNDTTMVVAQAHGGGMVGTGWTYGSPACAVLINGVLADEVTGRNAVDVTGASDAMAKALRNIGRQGVGGQALSAVDIALWDLKGRLLDTPLHRLLGAVRDSVPVYGSGGFTCYDRRQLHDQVSTWTNELGVDAVKIKIGESWGTRVTRDLERMRQVRSAVGDAVALYVDANGAYGRKQAVRLMTEAADLDVRWFEEPVSSDDLDGLRLVRDAVPADVTAGEYGYDIHYFRRMCAAGAVDCLQADVSRCGGITEWLRVAAIAASHGLQISAHCAPHLHLHVGAAAPNLRHLEWFHDHARIESMAFDGASLPVCGLLRPDPDAPGHGLTLRSADIEKYRAD